MTELEQLIAEQAHDMVYGHIAKMRNMTSLDAMGYEFATAVGAGLRKSRFPRLIEPISPLDSRHGTTAGYGAGCRQSCCRAAIAKYRYELKRRPGRTLSKDDYRHGTLVAYNNYMCRCSLCRRANTKYQKDYQRRRRCLLKYAA